MSYMSIDLLMILSHSIAMNKQGPFTLVLGSTGKTGSRVTAALINRGLPVRTAARSGADVTFDWSRRDSYAPAHHVTKSGDVHVCSCPLCPCQPLCSCPPVHAMCPCLHIHDGRGRQAFHPGRTC